MFTSVVTIVIHTSSRVDVYFTVTAGMDPSAEMDKKSEHSFVFNTAKRKNVSICNPDIFAQYIFGVKCCFHHSNDHFQAIQLTFTLKHGPGTEVHF